MDFDSRITLTRAKAAAIRRVFATVEGRVLLAHLHTEYRDNPIDTSDPTAIIRAVGQQDVIRDLDHIINNTDEDYLDDPV